MFRRTGSGRAAAFIAAAVCFAGCGVPAGQWQLVEVDPPGAAFPITQIEFGADGAYRSKGRVTPSGEATVKTESVTGKFEQERGFLRLVPTGHGAIGLGTRLRLDGRLVMTLQPPGRDWKVRGVFERVEPVDRRLLDAGTPITPEPLQKQPANLEGQ